MIPPTKAVYYKNGFAIQYRRLNCDNISTVTALDILFDYILFSAFEPFWGLESSGLALSESRNMESPDKNSKYNFWERTDSIIRV